MFTSAVVVTLAATLVDEAHAQVPEGAGAPNAVPRETPRIEAVAGPDGDRDKGAAPGENRVQRSINFGFARDPRSAPVMDHKIRDAGISLPQCVGESRDGQACK